MNLWETIIDAANETESGIPSAASIPSLVEYVRWANKAQDIIASYVGCIEKLITFSTVANQRKYTPGAEFIRPDYVEFAQSSAGKYKLQYTDIVDFRKLQSWNQTTGTPQAYTIYNRQIEIWPPRSSGATATTVTGVNAVGATTINVADTTGFSSGGGRVIINSSEIVEYTGLTATSFTGCTRGSEGSTAAAYVGAETVVNRDISVYSVVRYKTRPLYIWNTGTATFTLASATIQAGSTAPTFTSNTFAGDFVGAGTNPTKWYTISTVGANLTATAVFGETTATNSAYIVTPNLDIPAEFNDLILSYLLFRTYKRKEDTQKAMAEYANFQALMGDFTGMTINRGDEYARLHLDET